MFQPCICSRGTLPTNATPWTDPPAAAHPSKAVGLLNSYPFCHVQAQQRKYDTMDLVASIYRRLRLGSFPGTKLHSLYRDEVQVRLLFSFPGNCEVQHYFRALRAFPGTALHSLYRENVQVQRLFLYCQYYKSKVFLISWAPLAGGFPGIKLHSLYRDEVQMRLHRHFFVRTTAAAVEPATCPCPRRVGSPDAPYSSAGSSTSG